MSLPDYLIPPTPLKIARLRIESAGDSLIGQEITPTEAAELLAVIDQLRQRIQSRATKRPARHDDSVWAQAANPHIQLGSVYDQAAEQP